ncbi:MAG: Gldg family protein [Pseudomonadota bacterium]
MNNVLWFAGWVAAIALVTRSAFIAANRHGLANRSRLVRMFVIIAGVIVTAILAQWAIVNRDISIDFTHEQTYTPDASVLELVDALSEAVAVTYFGHGDDHRAGRLMRLLDILAQRSPHLSVQTFDPDKAPNLARQMGVSFYNVAVIEARGKRVYADSTDEKEIALAIQKALREKTSELCFVTGHGEAGIFNQEFHTHIESLGGADDHGHGHAHIPIVRSTPHGVGRMGRALKALGYSIREINLVTNPEVVSVCDVVSIVKPLHPFSQKEQEILNELLLEGVTILAFLDLAYPHGELTGFLETNGVHLNHDVIVDRQHHHENNIETLAITSYPQSVLTRDIAMTIFPGASSLSINPQFAALEPVVTAGPSAALSVIRAQDSPLSEVSSETKQTAAPVFIVKKEADDVGGKLLIAGEADFLTNTYFPYLSNSAFALAIYRWAVGEEDSVQTAPSLPVLNTVILTNRQMRQIFFLLVVVLPLAVVAVGAVVWLRQRQ